MNTPIAGDIQAVIDIKGRHRGTKTWVICSVCDIGRWVRSDGIRFKSYTGMCAGCHNKFTSGIGTKHPRWKGGTKNWAGYVLVKIQPDNLYYSMARKTGYIYEHRYVVAQHLGRLLTSIEVVHHKNGIKTDNRIENLELMSSRAEHIPSMAIQATISKLENRIKELEAHVCL